MARVLRVSGTTYDAALSDIPPASVRATSLGRSVFLQPPDERTREAWLDRMAEAAMDRSDAGDMTTHDAIARDMDRA